MNFKSGLQSISEGHYNEAPEGFREIEPELFALRFYMYMLKKQVSRQIIRIGGKFLKRSIPRIRLWEMVYKGCAGMGIGMSYDAMDKKFQYWEFGGKNNWKKFSDQFTSQFAGDNS